MASLLADGWDVHGTLLTFIDETPPAGTTGTPVEITDAEDMATLIAEVAPDAIFHLAGAASVGQSFGDPEGTWKVNVEGTRGVGFPHFDGHLRSGDHVARKAAPMSRRTRRSFTPEFRARR